MSPQPQPPVETVQTVDEPGTPCQRAAASGPAPERQSCTPPVGPARGGEYTTR